MDISESLKPTRLLEDECIQIPEDLKNFPYRATFDFEFYFQRETQHPRNTPKLICETYTVKRLHMLERAWLRPAKVFCVLWQPEGNGQAIRRLCG